MLIKVGLLSIPFSLCALVNLDFLCFCFLLFLSYTACSPCTLFIALISVTQGGSAYDAGLRKHDRILEVNSLNARGASHSDVVNQVVKGGGILDLIVIRVSEEEALRLQRLEDAATNRKAVSI